MPSGTPIMMNKRKRDDTSAGDDSGDNRDRRAKRPRVPNRARSEPLRTESVSAEKREALRRLFGRIGAVNIEENLHPGAEPDDLQFESLLTEEDENSLVEDVPADMDPEQLGFLVCAQETLRFLKGLGIAYHHPVFNNLRLRLLQGISEIGVA
ncbi:hypothetical protein PYW07_005068 [Mythimna separata]|uniref:Uncharacterized protein n=1 Tax=Mythimna separata TaxID=271217 RepID=A0AAD7YE89_MYTSE|nr:hypothetical protein PYW07_005068 [Mythimna separata]